MPQRPEKFSHFDRSQSADRFKERRNPNTQFYQSYKWRKFRAKQWAKMRRYDERRVHELYERDREIPFSDLNLWLQRSVAPLCRQCLDEHRIVGADVLDHITPINQGGEEFSAGNIQPMCHYHHNIKSAKESH